MTKKTLEMKRRSMSFESSTSTSFWAANIKNQPTELGLKIHKLASKRPFYPAEIKHSAEKTLPLKNLKTPNLLNLRRCRPPPSPLQCSVSCAELPVSPNLAAVPLLPRPRRYSVTSTATIPRKPSRATTNSNPSKRTPLPLSSNRNPPRCLLTTPPEFAPVCWTSMRETHLSMSVPMAVLSSPQLPLFLL